MKRYLFVPALVTFVAAIMVLAALAQSQDNNASGQNGLIDHAMETNSAEIQLGCLALSRSDDAQIRAFANMMVHDHWEAEQRIRETLGQTANDSGASPAENNAAGDQQSCKAIRETNQLVGLAPGDEQLYNRLSRLSGPEFDREYIDATVRNHRKDIQEFEGQAKVLDTDSTSVRQKPLPEGEGSDVARQLVPMLQKHLKAAETLQRQLAR